MYFLSSFIKNLCYFLFFKCSVNKNGKVFRIVKQYEKSMSDNNVPPRKVALNDLLSNRQGAVLAAVMRLERQPGQLQFLGTHMLQGDREQLLSDVRQNGKAFQFMSEIHRSDFEIALAAVKQDGNLLKHVPEKLKKNREIVCAAVNQNGKSLIHAPSKFKADNQMVVLALAYGGISKWHMNNINSNARGIVVKLRSEFDMFQLSFLAGWLSSRHDTTSQKPRFEDNEETIVCKLPMLNRLGKYVSVRVKRCIADYAGIYYGQRLTTLHDALTNIDAAPFVSTMSVYAEKKHLEAAFCKL